MDFEHRALLEPRAVTASRECHRPADAQAVTRRRGLADHRCAPPAHAATGHSWVGVGASCGFPGGSRLETGESGGVADVDAAGEAAAEPPIPAASPALPGTQAASGMRPRNAAIGRVKHGFLALPTRVTNPPAKVRFAERAPQWVPPCAKTISASRSLPIISSGLCLLPISKLLQDPK